MAREYRTAISAIKKKLNQIIKPIVKQSASKVYYYSDFGYIVCAETTVENTPMRTVINPVTMMEGDATAATLGNAILDSLEQSRNAQPISRKERDGYKFWQVSGIKGFASFSKKFLCISIEGKRNLLCLLKLVRESDGGYTEPINQLPIEVPADITAEQLGRIVFDLSHEKTEQYTDVIMTFETVHNRTVTYHRPSDVYLDCGDGHTDAYQIFALEDAPENRIAFLVDSGYSELNKTVIKKKWQKQYGDLLEFCFQSMNEPYLLYKIVGKTVFVKIISYLYRDGDGTMEVVALIDLQQPKGTQVGVETEFETMIRSILFS